MVVTQRFGQGKVTAIMTDSLWRWQLGPEAGKAKPYDRFWKQMISWLLPREESLDKVRLEIFSDRDQLFLVFGLEEALDGPGGQLLERLIGRGQDRERTLALEGVDQSGGRSGATAV